MLRFHIEKQSFLKSLRAMAGIGDRHRAADATSPVGGQVFVRLENQTVLSLTMLEQEIEWVATIHLKEPGVDGSMVLPLRKLFDICSAATEDKPLCFSQDSENNRLVLQTGRSRFNLSCFSVDAFPVLKHDFSGTVFSVSKLKLRTLLLQTEYAMADKDVRVYLNGVLWDIKQEKFSGVGADGHRLALWTILLEKNIETPLRVIVPRKVIATLERILVMREETISEVLDIKIGAQQIQFKTADARLTAPLLDAHFPDFWQIVNAIGKYTVTIEKEKLKAVLGRATAVLDDRSKGVSFHLNQNKLKIVAINTNQDEVEEDLEVDYEGPALTLGFNSQYLLDFLSVLSSEKLVMKVTGPNASAHLMALGDETPGHYVLMPMTI